MHASRAEQIESIDTAYTTTKVLSKFRRFHVERHKPCSTRFGNETGRKTVDATLVGRDARTDLAVLKVDTPNLSAVRWADPAGIRAGEPVVAIGFPLDLGAAPTVTTGVVSAKDRVINETLEIKGGRIGSRSAARSRPMP